MFSKREREGYVLIDHRESPGFTEQEKLAAGLSPLMPIGKGQCLEAPTLQCGRCQTHVIINPDRQRERGHCWKCDRYVCDDCGAIIKANGGDCDHTCFQHVYRAFQAMKG